MKNKDNDIRGGYAVTNESGKQIGRVKMSEVNENTVKIDEVVSEKKGERTGNGSAIMKMVVDNADKNNVKLVLTPNLIGEMKAKGFETADKLRSFYEKFGFVKDKGKATMTREPKEIEVKEEVKPTEVKEEITIEEEPTQSDIAKQQTIETDLLIGGQAAQRRKDNKYTKDGVEYIRNSKGNGVPSSVTGDVRFTNEVSLPFKYKLIEAKDLQPSHQDGMRNPNHFIPEAQPKNRNDAGSLMAENSFSSKPRFEELGENTNAYSGAPIVNERGEVVQGNNRAAGLRKGYDAKNKQYKNDLANNSSQFGFTKEQVEKMNEPILVREVAVSDEGAIEVGNYDVKDLETGGKRRLDPIAITRRMPFDIKGRIAEMLFTGEETLNQAIRANQKRVLELLNPYLNQAQRNTITKEGVLTDAGIKDLEDVVKQFLFDNGDTALPDLFENLSANQKEGLKKSLPYIFSTSPDKSIVPDIQEAILAVADFRDSGAGDFNAWLAQGDMFADGKTPRDKYTPLEIEIAKTLIEAKTQKEIVKKFGDYSDIVKDKEANMFDPAIAGKTRAEGIKEIFKTEDYAKPISERGGKTPSRKEELAAEPSPKPRAEKEKIAGKEAKKGVEEAYKDLTINQKRQIINSKFDEVLKELKIEKICPT
jgi:predicted GNAT family acetyltransferase